MNERQWIVWLAAGGFLAACATTSPPPQPPPPGEPGPSGQNSEVSATPAPCKPQANLTADRYRVWVLYSVESPEGAALEINSLDSEEEYPLQKGGEAYVIVRADVVDPNNSGGYNLVVPVDGANKAGYVAAVAELEQVIHATPAAELVVTHHTPWPPHCSHTVVTSGELDGWFLQEYFPPGRHPQSPGANPWG